MIKPVMPEMLFYWNDVCVSDNEEAKEINKESKSEKFERKSTVGV